MNADIERFFKKNGIEPMDLALIPIARTQAPDEINEIIANYGFRKPSERRNISIADIVGYDYNWMEVNPYIVYSLDSFFDSKGDGYHSRSVGLLDYTSNDVMDKVVFEHEIIAVDEMGDNKYVISYNGLHRYTVLRVLYLNEVMHARGNNEKLAKLREKYTIPVSCRGVDLFKTYSKYMLMKFSCGVRDIEKEYDSDTWEYTGRLVIIQDNNERSLIESDQELMKLVISKADIINQNISDLQGDYNRYPSFRRFLEKYYSRYINIDTLMEIFRESQLEGGIEEC